MSEDFEAIEKQLVAFIVAEGADQRALAAQLMSLLERFKGDEAGQQNLRGVMANAMTFAILALSQFGLR